MINAIMKSEFFYACLPKIYLLFYLIFQFIRLSHAFYILH